MIQKLVTTVKLQSHDIKCIYDQMMPKEDDPFTPATPYEDDALTPYGAEIPLTSQRSLSNHFLTAKALTKSNWEIHHHDFLRQ